MLYKPSHNIKRFQNFFYKNLLGEVIKKQYRLFRANLRFTQNFLFNFQYFSDFSCFCFFKGSKKYPKICIFFCQTGYIYFFFINLNVLLVSLYHVWNEKFLAPMKKKILLTCNFWDSQLQSKMTKMVKKGSWQKGNLPDPPHQELSNFIFSKNITIQGFKTGDRVSCKFPKNFAGLTEFLCFHNS